MPTPTQHTPGPTVYERLTAAGVPTDNHESDLYALATPVSRAIVAESGRSAATFRSAVDGKLWLDIPFAYDPFWESKAGRA